MTVTGNDGRGENALVLLNVRHFRRFRDFHRVGWHVPSDGRWCLRGGCLHDGVKPR